MYQDQESIAVLGAGAWGCALAILLAKNQQTVYLWDPDAQHIQNIQSTQTNQRHFPGLTLSERIHPLTDLSDTLSKAQDILIVAPSHAFTDLIRSLPSHVTENSRIAWATKGLDPKTSLFFDEIVTQILGAHIPKAILSGPSFAKEVAEGKLTHVVLASQQDSFAHSLSVRFENPQFKVQLSQDIIGVQLCGALKNVLAIAIGMSDGLNLGANARAALMTYALQEITTLGTSLGAIPETFTGLAGLGDMILTCTDNQSRNRRFGFALGTGKTIAEAEQEIAQTIEGKITTLNAYQMLQQRGLTCRFIQEVYDVLYGQKSIREALDQLLT